jgi:tRNA pseudouridine38-40 synthase
MACFKLTIAYDGTTLVGWQRQASGVSVQGLLEEALEPLAGRPVTVTGAGRTDAGVHALGQVASVAFETTADAMTVLRAVNARLPPVVRILSCEPAADRFHARFDARSKRYRYRLANTLVQSPFERHYGWHVPTPPLDMDAMNAAARLLEGEHDFSAFQTTGGDTLTTVRRIFSSRVVGDDDPWVGDLLWPDDSIPPGASRFGRNANWPSGHLLRYEVWGNGFLRHMVRAIVGSLVEVGRGARKPDWFIDLISGRDRAQAGRTAPPTGLFLERVHYDEPDLAARR